MNTTDTGSGTDTSTTVKLVLAWLWVGIPLAWGVWVTLNNALQLFTATKTT
ncbi:MAG: hypothetical protein JWN27_2351 [Candidatus Eremiobacteraeota bacterium]|nr:hypothetical protein [Candidatus Eremiobacteraeota bacterium]